MEQYIFPAIAAVAGLLLSWLLCRIRAERTEYAFRQAHETELALLRERHDVLATRVEQLEAELDASTDDTRELQEQLRRELTLRATAEERNRRLPELEQLISFREGEIRVLQERITDLESSIRENVTRLEEQTRSSKEKLEAIEHAKTLLTDTFRALSAEALQSNNQNFIQLAAESFARFNEAAKNTLEQKEQAVQLLVTPIQESLCKVDAKLGEIEKTRENAYTGITEAIRAVQESHSLLRTETANLTRALRSPTVRGRWGEIQLKRVVEMAGMLEYCDFVQQESSAEGLRPDLVVKLPNSKNIVVDAKAPLQSYLESLDLTAEELRVAKLREHAKHIRGHLTALSAKSYWDQFSPTPDFVVLFLPSEAFFSAALEQDPSLIEFGVGQRVILSTPTTLIALFRAVAYGWRQEQLATNAAQISKLGGELFERLCKFSEHLASVGTNLKRAVLSYNRSVASFENRTLVTARRFKELGGGSTTEIPLGAQIDVIPKSVGALGETTADSALLETLEEMSDEG